MMTKKSFFIILILSVVVTYIVEIAQSLFTNSSIAGSGGLPFAFTSSALFGSPSTDYLMLIIDILFWFIVILVIWKVLQKIISK